MEQKELRKQEVLDLYDNNFCKLDKTIVRRKDEIPENTNIMASYVIIQNNHKYLLEQSTERNQYRWAIPGGHVLHNEDGEQGLRRELKEELGIDGIDLQFIDTIKYPYHNYIFNIYYSDHIISFEKLILQPEEVLKVEWFSKEEILKLIEEEKIAKGYAYLLKRYM